MRYNHLLNSHFRDCELIAQVVDPHRGRRINIYHLGDLSEEGKSVGLTDGVDSWIAPALTTFPHLDLPILLTAKVTPRGRAAHTHPSQVPQQLGRRRVQLSA